MRLSAWLLVLASVASVTAFGAVARAEEAAATPAPTATATDTTRQLRFGLGASFTSVSVLTLVVGSVLGARAIVDKNQIGAHCDRSFRCDLVGYTLGSEAQDFADNATVMFIIGLTSAAAGIPLLVSARPASSTAGTREPSTPAFSSARLALTGRGLAITGSW